MKFIILMLLTFLTATTSFAGVTDYSQDNLVGKVLEVVKAGGQVFVKIDTTDEGVWVGMLNTKLARGKTYEFYPTYAVTTNVKLSGTKKVLKKVLHTLGPVKPNIDHEKYSFKGIKIGTPMNDVVSRLKTIDNNVELKIPELQEGLYSAVLNDFMLADESFTVEFWGDSSGNLMRYNFVKTRVIHPDDAQWIQQNLQYITEVFTKKYGPPTSCKKVDFDKVVYEKNISMCIWEVGDYGIETCYSQNDGFGRVYGNVSSLTRSLRMVYKLNQIIQKNKIELQKMKDDYAKEIVEKGASSY